MVKVDPCHRNVLRRTSPSEKVLEEHGLATAAWCMELKHPLVAILKEQLHDSVLKVPFEVSVAGFAVSEGT